MRKKWVSVCLMLAMVLIFASAFAESAYPPSFQIAGLQFQVIDGKFYMYDEARQIRLFDAQGQDARELRQHMDTVLPICISDSGESPEYAFAVYKEMASLYDYCLANLGITGIDGGGRTVNVFMNHLSGQEGSGAFAFSDDSIAFFPNANQHNPSVLAGGTQAYMRLVITNAVRLSSEPISLSLNEGYAMALGMLYDRDTAPREPQEQWVYGFKGGEPQHFQDPLLSSNAKAVGGENYYTNFGTSQGAKQVAARKNAGVLEHAVYQMSIGGIPDQDLARLLYQSLLALSAPGGDAASSYTYNWQDLRWAWEEAADQLSMAGTEKDAIAKAFDIVNIPVGSVPQPYAYNVKGDNVEIVGYTNQLGDNLAIPAQIEGKPVTAIADWAFYAASPLKVVVIPGSVESVGAAAFYRCTNLTAVGLPKKLKTIEAHTFRDCGSLLSVDIPDSVLSIGDSAFVSCTSLSAIELPKNLETIGPYAFTDCRSLLTLDIPDSVLSIGNTAFYDCVSLTAIGLPSNLKAIEHHTFGNCWSLLSIDIPETVTDIGDVAFGTCRLLDGVALPTGLQSLGWFAFGNCESLVSMKIPDGIQTIRTRTFENCMKLSALYLPPSVTAIEDYAVHAGESNIWIPLPSLTIYGERESYAEGFAHDNGIQFKAGSLPE